MNRRPGALAAVCGAWLALSGCRCGQPGPAPAAPTPAIAVADRPAVLATLPDGAPAVEREFLFGELGGGVAWVEVQGGSLKVVHNGRAGKGYVAVAELAISPDGRRCAHAAKVGDGWRMVVDGTEGQGFDELLAPVFSPDGQHLAWQARAGSRWHLVVDGAMSEGSATPLLGHQFSGDSTRIAFIDGDDGRGSGRLVVSDLAFKAPVVVDGKASMLRVNADRTRAAFASASASGDQAQVVVFAFERPGEARRGPKFEAVSMITFGPDGRALAYLGERGVQVIMVLDDREEALPPGQYFGPPAIRPDGKAVGIFVLTGDEVRLHQAFAEGGPREVVPGEGDGLAYSSAGVPAYAASRGEKHHLVVGGKEGPPFDRVVSPAFSPDGKLVVYRARQAGKRFVVVADLEGRTVRQHPPYEQVFPVRFTADGKSVAYGVKDGPRLEWKVEPL